MLGRVIDAASLVSAALIATMLLRHVGVSIIKFGFWLFVGVGVLSAVLYVAV